MSPSYLIDTDWIIHYLNGTERVVGKLLSLREQGLAVSIISIAELYEGVYSSTDPAGSERALRDFLSGVSILSIDEEISKIFGRERGRLRRRGRIVGDLYLLIASTSLHHKLTLLTDNKAHYEAVEGLTLA